MNRSSAAVASLAALLALSTLLAVPLPAASQEPFVVVVHASNPVASFSRDQVARLFMRQTGRWPNGRPVEPVDQPAGAPVRDSFSRAVHRRSASSIVSHWRQQIFSGRGVPPPEQAGDAAVVRYVAGRRGGVGYVRAGTELRGVKALRVTGL